MVAAMAQASWWTRATSFLRKQRDDVSEASNNNGRSTVRLVIDTNVFIAAVRAPDSSSRKLLDAVAAGEARLLVSPPVFREYQQVLPKAVQSQDRERLIRGWLSGAEAVAADRGERVVVDDPDDDKFVELAVAGKADAIVSNDEHLLGLGGKVSVPVKRPGEALSLVRGDSE